MRNREGKEIGYLRGWIDDETVQELRRQTDILVNPCVKHTGCPRGLVRFYYSCFSSSEVLFHLGLFLWCCPRSLVQFYQYTSYVKVYTAPCQTNWRSKNSCPILSVYKLCKSIHSLMCQTYCLSKKSCPILLVYSLCKIRNCPMCQTYWPSKILAQFYEYIR